MTRLMKLLLRSGLVTVFSFSMLTSVFAADPVLTDIQGHKYESAINYVQSRGIVEGYNDGTFKPDKLINRAEFTKILVGHLYSEGDLGTLTAQDCFTDVPSGEWYTRYVCFAQNKQIISGYPNGNFKPTDNINYAEALKIVIEANVKKGNLDLGLRSVGKYWYSEYVDFVESNCKETTNTILSTKCLSLWGKLSFDQKITRAETAVIIRWMSLMTQ